MESLCQRKLAMDLLKNNNVEMDSNPNIFYDFPEVSKDPVSAEKIILFRINIVNKYISYLLEGVWGEDVTEIDKKLSYILI